MADKDKTIDPYDVEALEKSLNDSATRVSTIWVSYLVFGLYVVIAAGSVTHRQLFLEDPVKLPILNIDLPLVGFFILAPILFIVVHAYVLIQIVLLARTGAAYNDAVDRHVKLTVDNARVRQRLANTLFAQIFAGSSREREGVLGWLLHAMAWATLAVAPLAILLTCEFKLLPYHSHWATWGHRILITLEFMICMLFWLSVRQRPNELLRHYVLRRWWICLPAVFVAISFVLFYGAILSFPGEQHASWTRWSDKSTDIRSSNLTICNHRNIVGTLYSPTFDRLSLPREDFVDDEKLAKIESATRERKLPAHSGERARIFRDRDLRCGNFEGADLRRVDFTGADLRGARLVRAELQGTTFERAYLQYSNLSWARLQSTNFTNAQLQGSEMEGAQLQSAYFDRTILQGTALSNSDFQNATIVESHMQGATLRNANFQGASFFGVQLQGADMWRSRFQGTEFYADSQLQATDFSDTQLAGASFRDSQLNLARFNRAYVWRSGAALCSDAQLVDLRFDPVIAIPDEFDDQPNTLESDPEAIERFIERISTNVPQDDKSNFQKKLRSKLIGERDQNVVETEVSWRSCVSTALAQSQYESRLANYLADVACWQNSNQEDISNGIYRNWMNDETLSNTFKRVFARRLLGMDGVACPNIEDVLSEEIMRSLRPIAEIEVVD